MSSLANATESGQLSVLRIGGGDARAFLQGQLSNDLCLLTRDNSLLAALNTPQGRVVAIVRLFERADGICAVLPRSLMASVVDRMRRYVLRSKVSLAAADELVVAAVASDAARRLGAMPSGDAVPCTALHSETDGISLLKYIDSVPRALIVGTPALVEQFLDQTGIRAAPWNDWRLAQIAAGEPQVYPATSEHFVAQMLNLDLVGGLSFTKGCYTGQEIIVRTQHLGRIKRRMVRARHSTGDSSPGDKLFAGEAAAGEVVDRAAGTDGPIEILAIVQAAQPVQALRLGGSTPVAPLTLPYAVETG